VLYCVAATKTPDDPVRHIAHDIKRAVSTRQRKSPINSKEPYAHAKERALQKSCQNSCIHTFKRALCTPKSTLYVPSKTEHSMQHTATHCNTLQHTATHCNTLHHNATHCNTQQHTVTLCNTLHYTVPHNALQHAATHNNTLQHTAIHSNTLLHSATHYTTLQRTMHCNTLQHTTIH